MTRAAPWIIALLVSVLVNGLLAGFVWHRTSGGPDWNPARMERPHGPPGRPPGGEGGPPPGGFNARGFIDTLPPAQRREAMRRFREEAPVVRELTRQAAQARLDAQETLIADPYDPEAAAAALTEMRERQNAIQAHIEGMVVELIADLDPETRQAALEAGRRRFEDLRDRRRMRRPDGPPGGPGDRMRERMRDRLEEERLEEGRREERF
jgi:uncharacterized membrane protein